jgi:hypothetical protein
MPSFADLDALARALPEVEVRFSKDDRPEYRVRGKLFACLRSRRQDAIDPASGEPLDDVVMLRTSGLIAKATMLADPDLPLFTTSHFDGWPAVLVRARDLVRVAPERLAELVEGAWASQAPKRLVAARAAERPAD